MEPHLLRCESRQVDVAGEGRMKKHFIRNSFLAIVLATVSTGVLDAQDPQSPHSDQPQPRTGQQQADTARRPQQKAFAGVIVKEGKRLVLQDPASKVTYKVDDEAKVQDYVGKQVKILGTLDASNVLHVESIEPVS